MLKPLYILLGTISLDLGMIGIVVPCLPTTPFLLLTAYLYLRSSQKLYDRLINSKKLGLYIKNFSCGIDKKTKIVSSIIMWIMILISGFIFIKSWAISITLFIIGIIGTIVMCCVVPTIDQRKVLRWTNKMSNFKVIFIFQSMNYKLFN